MINVLICDDSVAILNGVNALVSKWSDLHKVDFCIDTKTSAELVLEAKHTYDIAFIDIELPGMSGLQLAEELKKGNPDIIVIVITSYQSYLDSAMKIRVFRYLSKPIEIKRFNANLLDAVEEYRNISETIIVSEKDDVFYLKTKDILFIENRKNGSMIVTKDREIKTNKKPHEWLQIINQPRFFIYSHKSFIVNLQNVTSFSKTSVFFKKADGTSVSAHISQRNYSEFRHAFFSFAGGTV